MNPVTTARINAILDEEPHVHAMAMAEPQAKAAMSLPPWIGVLWPYVQALLVEYGLPMARQGLVELRGHLETTMKPGFAKRAILAVLDSLIGDSGFMRQLGVNDA